MARVVLNSNYQVVASTVWDWGPTKLTLYLEARLLNQYTNLNASTFQTRLRSELNYGYGGGYGYNFGGSYLPTVSGSNYWTLATEVISESGTVSVYHDADGNKTIRLYANASISGLGVSSSFDNSEVVFPQIYRASALNSASMTIPNNGTGVTITPNLTKYVSSYYDCLTIKDGNTTLFTLDGVSNGVAASLSSGNITTLYNAIGTNMSKVFTCYITTYTSSSKTSSVGTSASVNLTATLPSYSISMSVAVEDTITAYNRYKPNLNTYIANVSKPKFTMTSTTTYNSNYGRTIGYTLNGTSISNPYTMNNYTGQAISITGSDGRKSDTKTPTMTHIAYFNPTLTTSVVRTTPTGSTIDISVSGTLYKGTGLTDLLTPTMKFKYTQSGDSEQEVTIPLTLTDSGDVTSFTGTYQLTGMNYQKSIDWSAILTDRIGITANNGDTLSQGLPVFNCYRVSDTNYMNIYGDLLRNEEKILTIEYDIVDTW